MKSYSTITTNIASDLDLWLTKEAKREDMSKRAFLERALRSFRIAKEREEYAEGFSRMSQDKKFVKEVRWLVEAGLGDSLKMIERYENV